MQPAEGCSIFPAANSVQSGFTRHSRPCRKWCHSLLYSWIRPAMAEPNGASIISTWQARRRAASAAAGGEDAWAPEGKVVLPYISSGMRDWQTAPCGEACCFVSCCGKTGCSARGARCLGSVTRPGAEHFVCLEADCVLSIGSGECAMWCAACYADGEIQHEHGLFLRVDAAGLHCVAPARPVLAQRVPMVLADIPTVPFTGAARRPRRLCRSTHYLLPLPLPLFHSVCPLPQRRTLFVSLAAKTFWQTRRVDVLSQRHTPAAPLRRRTR